MVDVKEVDRMMESFRCINDLFGILVVSLGAYSDEMMESGAFTCSEIFHNYNEISPSDERIDIGRIELLLKNKKRSVCALSNLRTMILRETVIYIYETALSEFKNKPFYRRVVSSPLVSIAAIIRNTIAHKKLMKREGDIKKTKFDANGNLRWNGVVVRKSDIVKAEQLTTKVISRNNAWKVINGMRDLISLLANGAVESEIVAFCTKQ